MHDCSGCAYWRPLGWKATTKYKKPIYCCHYALDEHKLRGCDAGPDCIRRTVKYRRKRRFNNGPVEEVTAK